MTPPSGPTVTPPPAPPVVSPGPPPAPDPVVSLVAPGPWPLGLLRSDDEHAARSAANATLVVDNAVMVKSRERWVIRIDMEGISVHPTCSEASMCVSGDAHNRESTHRIVASFSRWMREATESQSKPTLEALLPSCENPRPEEAWLGMNSARTWEPFETIESEDALDQPGELHRREGQGRHGDRGHRRACRAATSGQGWKVSPSIAHRARRDRSRSPTSRARARSSTSG